MIFRRVESMQLLGGERLILTLECKHQYEFKQGAFRNRPFPTDKTGARVWRCRQCEKLQTEGGKGA